jgi:hypothetical protein
VALLPFGRSLAYAFVALRLIVFKAYVTFNFWISLFRICAFNPLLVLL